jgi:hypothetical protein
MALSIQPATRADHPAILALNLESEHLLSPLDAARLQQLDAQAAYHRVVCDGDAVAGFLLAFREGADYDSPNYLWFGQRYPAFLYVDRIAIAASHQAGSWGACCTKTCLPLRVRRASTRWPASSMSSRSTKRRNVSMRGSGSAKSARNGSRTAARKYRCR